MRCARDGRDWGCSFGYSDPRISFQLTNKGLVSNERVTESSGSKHIDDAAIQAVRDAELSSLPFPEDMPEMVKIKGTFRWRLIEADR